MTRPGYEAPYECHECEAPTYESLCTQCRDQMNATFKASGFSVTDTGGGCFAYVHQGPYENTFVADRDGDFPVPGEWVAVWGEDHGGNPTSAPAPVPSPESFLRDWNGEA